MNLEALARHRGASGLQDRSGRVARKLECDSFNLAVKLHSYLTEKPALNYQENSGELYAAEQAASQ
jgi:hypothetical protein